MKRVYFHEFNILMENTIFLPLVSGQLQAYAQTKKVIRDNYEFMPLIFVKENPERIFERYNNPSVAAFSCSMWNMNLNLALAAMIRNKYPNCLIVFGGHHVPREGKKFLKEHPWVDVTIRGEGELDFAEILERFTRIRDFRDITGISYRGPSYLSYHRTSDCDLVENLDELPSPYLEGLFDYLLDSKYKVQPIIETNRGCPFRCTYCSWSGENTKLRFYSIERVKQLLDWCGKNKMKFILCADANFGIVKRDLDIAKYVVETKEKYGCPEIFRMCYGKNTEETMFQIGKLLNEYKLTKAISMARQSNNPEVLKNVGRENIKMSVFDNLQKRFNEAGIPTSTDIILGLPGETYKSFVDGIEEILESSFKSQLLIYPLQIYPNTQLDKERDKFGIKTVTLPLMEVHGSIHNTGDIVENEELVISTNTMPLEDWKQAVMMTFVVQLLHSLKLGFFISTFLFDRYHIKYTDFYQYLIDYGAKGILGEELDEYFSIVESIVKGNPRGQTMWEFSETYWEVEEASYLRVSLNKSDFYDSFLSALVKFLDLRSSESLNELIGIVVYQQSRIPNLYHESKEHYFNYNVPEYFDKYFTPEWCNLIKKPQKMIIESKEYNSDKVAFAREVLLYGRKSEKMLNTVKWEDI